MKKLIIFDLKGTLIDDKFNVTNDYISIFKELDKKAIKSVLYSMNEPWTYKAIRQPEFNVDCFEKILLVSKKRVKDIQSFCLGYKQGDILVVGDGEEVKFADSIGISTVSLENLLTTMEISAALEGGSNDLCV